MHFIGLTRAAPEGKGGERKSGFAIQCDKDNYRGIEGVTGKKAVDSETRTVKN